MPLIFYEILCLTTNFSYIGSTCQAIENRMAVHTSSYKAYQAGRCSYYSSFEIIKNNNWVVNILETVDDASPINRYNREFYWLSLFKDRAVNSNVPNRSVKQYYRDNKIEILNRMNKKYQDNIGGYRDHMRNKYQLRKQLMEEQAIQQIIMDELE